MNQEIKGLICVKIPKEQTAFLEANPRLVKVVGNVVGNLVDVYGKIEKMSDTLKDPNFLTELIDAGTVDQAIEFVNMALKSAKDGAIMIDNVSREVLDKVKEKLGKEVIETML